MFSAQVIIDRLKGRCAATVILLDHPGKTTAAGYAGRGASTKEADADLVMVFRFDKQPSRTEPGKMWVGLHKDREDVLKSTGAWKPSKQAVAVDGERHFVVGDGKGGLPVIPMDQPEENYDDPRERELRTAIIATVRNNPQTLFSGRMLLDTVRAEHRGLKFDESRFRPMLVEFQSQPTFGVEATQTGPPRAGINRRTTPATPTPLGDLGGGLRRWGCAQGAMRPVCTPPRSPEGEGLARVPRGRRRRSTALGSNRRRFSV